MTTLTPASLKAYLTSNRCPDAIKTAYNNGVDNVAAALGNDRASANKGAVRADPVSAAFFKFSIIAVSEQDLPSNLLDWISTMIDGQDVDIGDPAVQSVLKLKFPQNQYPLTFANINAAASRDGSPFEVEFGANTVISDAQIGAARNA